MKIGKIRQLNKQLFEGRITIDGKQKSIYGKSITEVKNKIIELRKEISKGNGIAQNIKLNVAMQSYLEDIKKSKIKSTSYDRIENTFKYHIKNESIGRRQIGTITAQDIQKLLTQKCNEGLSASSIKKIYNLFGEFFRYAVATGEVPRNPMELVTMPHNSKIQHHAKEMEVLTADEMKRVISVAESTDVNQNPNYRYGEAIVLLFLTGIRSGELRGIKKEDIDFNRCVLHIHRNVTYAKDRENGGIQYHIGDTKTKNSNREIPLNARAILSLKRLLATTYNPENGYLLCTSNGCIVTHSHLHRCYAGMLKKAGLPHMGLHSTRHTFATVVLKNAEDKGQIKEVSELLGHSQVSTTYEYYIKTSNEDKRNLIGQLDSLIS